MGIAGDGGVPVSGPECRPQRFGLESVAQVVLHGDGEFTKGVEWDELPCDFEVSAVAGQCPPLVEHLKTSSRGFNTLFADAFTMYAGYECSTGGTPLGVAWDNAQTLLEKRLWKGIERALWTGLDQDDNALKSSFAQVDENDDLLVVDLTPPAGALDITSGLAALESYMGDCTGCEGVIHANRGFGPYLSERSQLMRDGDVMRLASTGSLVALGSGYPASGPGGSAAPPDEAWIFITGGVTVNFGEMFFTPDKGDVAGAVDRVVNDIEVFAEKPVALQLGCCIGAVRVVLDSCCPSIADESS